MREVVSRMWVLNLIGGIGHIFFFYVQENFYERPNFLAPINDFLGGQCSATSFFVVLGTLAIGVMIAMGIGTLLKLPNWLKQAFLYLTIVAGGLVYTLYEYAQYYHPEYPDNNLLDVIVCWIAVVIVIYIVQRTIRNNP